MKYYEIIMIFVRFGGRIGKILGEGFGGRFLTRKQSLCVITDPVRNIFFSLSFRRSVSN